MAIGLAMPRVTHAQVPPGTNQQRLAELQQALKAKGVAEKAAARRWASQHAIPLRRELPNGRTLELQRMGPRGPVFYITHNVDAADSISTDELWPGGGLGLSLAGQGLTLGEWDSGRVLLEHPDLYDRATQMDENDDPAPVHSDHATHVAGTLIGNGGSQYPQARGMAAGAYLQAWDWNKDREEMSAAAAGLLVSNHSYSIAAGWIPYGQAEPDNWWWIGGDGDEDPNFGYYDEEARELDQIANAAPYYLMVKAAGNDRWDIGPEAGETYTIVDQDGISQGTSTQQRPADCGQTGYDCLPGAVVAKNILTVGAVNDVNGGYLPLQGPGSVQMTGFSSYGPTDDGRIKPDLVANGWLLLSTWGAPNYFAVIAGTSMAAPSVSGSLLLLQEHYEDLHGSGNFMRAATLKALAIHTADETGLADGPDYEYGWGLMNTTKAAQLITADGNGDHQIVEGTRLDPSAPDAVGFSVTEEGARVRATLVWNDPAGTPPPAALDPTESMLVNDLDLRVVGNGNTHQPWVLNPLSPAAAATRGDNTRDNVEMVEFVASAGNYSAQVSHKNNLQGGSQNYSLIISVRPPAPVSSGLIIDEHFDAGVQPAGWTLDTQMGVPWTFHLDGSGDFANQTGGSGGFAMMYNNGTNNSISSLVLPPLDLSESESVTLRFRSYYSFTDGLEAISVYTSADGGANWSHAQSFSTSNHFPSSYVLDLSNKVAGEADARIRFHFTSNWNNNVGWNWQVDDVEVEVFGGGSVGGGPPPPLELPGQADMPSPISGATDIGTSPTLAWISAPTADSHNVYFGTSLDLQNPDFRGNQAGTQFSPGILANNTTYFWRVDEVNQAGTTAGVVWNFTTEPGDPPPPGPITLHVADLEMSAEPLARNRWQANVRVRVLDDEGTPVAAATVTGQWSDGANGSDSQATDSLGWASFGKSNLKSAVGSVTFSIADITHASLTYAPGNNADADGDSNGSTILVPKDAPPPPANAPPVISMLSPVEGQQFAAGAEVALSANADDAEDGDLDAAISWTSGGQILATGPTGSHPFDEGVHTVTASVTDSGGDSASQSVTITVGNPTVASGVVVDQLQDLSMGGARRWTAVVGITVRDDLGNAVAGATVSGDWSAGAKGGGSCVTGPAGQCEISKGNKDSVASVVFTVTGIAASGLSYAGGGPASIELVQP
ncbi:S8 family serine peptidase [Seongchinamella unica]|nr:S8 family serine peptidase [Seongchinamella unica]